MKTPLRGEMLRGADFIIGVVSAKSSDPIQTFSATDTDQETTGSCTKSMLTGQVLNISDDRTEVETRRVHFKVGGVVMQDRNAIFHWTPAWVLSTLKTKCLD